MAAQAEEPISAHIDSPHRSAAHLPEHVAAPIGAQAAAEASRTVHAAPCCSLPWRWGCCSSAGSPFISSSSGREVPLADEASNPLLRPLPSGMVPQDEVDRTEKRWLIIMLGMLALMMVVIVVTGITHALHPPSNVEPTDPVTLHLQGEFVESNLGTAQLELDGVTVRLIAQQARLCAELRRLDDLGRADDHQYDRMEARQSGRAGAARHVCDHRNRIAVGLGSQRVVIELLGVILPAAFGWTTKIDAVRAREVLVPAVRDHHAAAGALPRHPTRFCRAEPAGHDPVREVRPASAAEPPERTIRPRGDRPQRVDAGRPGRCLYDGPAPLHSLIEAHVLAAERLHGDDTTVPILAKGRRSRATSGPMSGMIGPLAAARRRPPFITLHEIDEQEILSAICTASPASCRPMPTAATTRFTTHRVPKERSRRHCAGPQASVLRSGRHRRQCTARKGCPADLAGRAGGGQVHRFAVRHRARH